MASCHSKFAVYEVINSRTIVRVHLGTYIENVNILAYAAQYKYLGLVLTEHLDYAATAKFFLQVVNRALGLLIAKSKEFGGLQYEPFTKLFE